MDVLSASAYDNKIAWYKNGGGSPLTWTPYTISTATSIARSVFAADIDGDGRVDAVSGSYDDDKVAWYKNGGGSPLSWTAYTISTSADGVRSVHAADVNGDGRVDTLSASVFDGKVAWYRNEGGSPVSWTSFVVASGLGCAEAVAAADIDGDGHLDVVSASYFDSRIAWYKNGGGASPTWTTYDISTTANGAMSVFVADIDGDGKLDTLSAAELADKVTWYKNGGGSPPSWTPQEISTTADAVQFVYAADVDGDGLVDVLSASCEDDKIAWYKNGGGSTPAWTPYNISTSADGSFGVFAADIDGDGRVDALSASNYDGRIVLYANNMCPRGFYGPDGGYAPCSLCPPGRYSDTNLQLSCTACPAGRFGSVAGSFNASAACAGLCAAGYMCPPGSTNATAVPCPAGSYSLAFAASCMDCPAGLYGALPATGTSSCTAPCRPGTFGVTGGQTSPTCSGNCTAGYACPAGSTSPTAQQCPIGRYSVAGSAVCPECPAGVYGDSVGLISPTCSGPCAVGYVCPPGSNTSTPVPACTAGRYGDTSTGQCVDCPAGRFGPAAGAVSLAACTMCTAGFFGNTSGVSVARCAGACPAGYFCPGRGHATCACWSAQLTFRQPICVRVLYAHARCLTNAVSTLACSEATVSPQPCGNVTVYCPTGSLEPTLVTDGYYTAVASGVATNAANIMAQAVECPAGSYCSGGVRQLCPPGTFQSSLRQSNVSSCDACAPGGFCQEGSSGPLPCGNDTVYCPAGSTAPVAGARVHVCNTVHVLLCSVIPSPESTVGCMLPVVT